jgi:hypothetical protein
VARSTGLLQLARSDLQRTEVEYALAGAQLEAAATVVRSGQMGPFHWASSTDLGFVDIVAEPESPKLTLAAAATLPRAALEAFGAADAEALQSRLAASAGNANPVNVTELDPSPLWRACGPRLVSPFGGRTAYQFVPDQQPEPGKKTAWWRVSEVWRIRVATAAGWRDDRIVRFTGDAKHPAATVARWLSRGEGDGGRCEGLLKSVAAISATTATP